MLNGYLCSNFLAFSFIHVCINSLIYCLIQEIDQFEMNLFLYFGLFATCK